MKCPACLELRDLHIFALYNGKQYICKICIEQMDEDLKEVM